MVSLNKVSDSRENLIESYILACDQEISFYKIGGIKRGNYLRNKLYYLELYLMSHDLIIELNNDSVDVSLLITDDDINKLISNTNELIKSLFNYETN